MKTLQKLKNFREYIYRATNSTKKHKGGECEIMMNNSSVHTNSGYVTIRRGDYWDCPHYMTDVANCIASDLKFDKRCSECSVHIKEMNNLRKGD